MSQRKRKPNSPKTSAPVVDNGGFYRAFEERFRGPRTLIKKRLEVYLPFVKPLLDQHRLAKVLDLGCGRGEWLELMRETGFEVEGIDLDAGMLQACAPLDLPVVQGDAIDFLKKKEAASHSVISAFHVAEHISFERLTELTAEALRVLKPGGMLILETPNPENLVVATSSFYLDPTHERPIPPQLLAFLPEHKGFKRTKILRLQESADLSQNPAPGLLAVLNGVSPDYAVVAQKTAPKKILAVFDEAFSREYGLSLETLADRCDARQQQAEEKAGQAEEKAGQAEEKAGQAEEKAGQAEEKAGQAEEKAGQAEERAGQAEAKAGQAEAKAGQAEARAGQAEARAGQAEAKAGQAEAKAGQAEAKAGQAEAKAGQAEARAGQAEARAGQAEEKAGQAEAKAGQAEEKAGQAEEKAGQAEEKAGQAEAIARQALDAAHHAEAVGQRAEEQLRAIYNSRSWRITQPLRAAADAVRWFKRGTIAWLTFAPQSRPRRTLRLALMHLKLYVARRPGLKRALLKCLQPFPRLELRLRQVGVEPVVVPNVIPRPVEHVDSTENNSSAALEALSPRARQIYHDLKAAIEQRQKEQN